MEVKTVLQRNAFRFKKQYGQNFITDEGLLDRIVEAAGIDENATVVEIGPGAGTLTRAIARRAKKVIAFEIDASLKPVLAETLSDVPNAEVVFRDFMQVDLAEFERNMPPYTVIANIPYYITTPLVMRFVEESKRVERIVVTIQEEVARRFCAKENTADYGAVTAGIALRGRAFIAEHIPRTMFYPVPNVDSAVVRIDMEEGRIPVRSRKAYRETVKCAFGSRRKTLCNNLMTSFSLSREEANAALSSIGVESMARGESLSPEQLAKLSDVLADKLPALRE